MYNITVFFFLSIMIYCVSRKDLLSDESLVRQREIAKEERKLKAIKQKVISFSNLVNHKLVILTNSWFHFFLNVCYLIFQREEETQALKDKVQHFLIFLCYPLLFQLFDRYCLFVCLFACCYFCC